MAANKKRATNKPLGKSTAASSKAAKGKAPSVVASAKPSKSGAKSKPTKGTKQSAEQPVAKAAKAVVPKASIPKAPAARATAKKPAKPAAKVAAPNKPGVAKAEPKKPSTSSGMASPGSSLEGSTLPEFSLADHSGAVVEQKALLGEPFVLYFYPKDDTPGCTKEACDFNAGLAEFESAGVRVIGVSPDSVARHTNFRTKYGLQFTLLSDPDAALARALDVYKMKKNYGREYMGIERTTFLVDGAGVIRKVWRGVRVAGHVPDVMAAVRGLWLVS